MSERYKLGLSRNRLFEFNNTVVFYGRYKADIVENEAVKVLKMLSVKEPVITSVIEYEDNGDAYIVTDVADIKMNFSSLNVKELSSKYQREPLDFTEKLFEFSVSSDGFLVIAGHTVVCDAKSLLRLASYFISFYEKTNLSVESSEIYTFSKQGTLPVDVVSPMINKLSSELDGKWQKDIVKYSVEDYKKASEKYFSTFPQVGEISFCISHDERALLRKKCEALNVDFSSMLYFCFYTAILNNVKAPKNSSKMRIYADRRFFHGAKDIYSVGAYNGMACSSLKPRDAKKSLNDKLKAFHTEVYRAVTSPYRVFADEVLLASLSSTYCDSSYIYMAGKNKFKSSKTLAENYGCMNMELCDCLYCNLTQQYWSTLSALGNVFVKEPFKLRSNMGLTIIETKTGCEILFEYNKSKFSDDVVNSVVSQAKNMLFEF